MARRVTPEDVADFGDRVAGALRSSLGQEFVGAYFVGSIALGGYVSGQSDIDIAAVCEQTIPHDTRQAIATELLQVTTHCPARGLEFSLYRLDVVSSPPEGADFEVNVNGGPRMDVRVRLSPDEQPGFWYVLDRAIAHRHGVTIAGPPAADVFADAPRERLLDAMRESMRWHRTHERATLYSVLNGCRAWRFAAEDTLGSKLAGAAWARSRWHDRSLIDAAVDLRHGRAARLDEDAVDEFLVHVEHALDGATGAHDDGALVP